MTDRFPDYDVLDKRHTPSWNDKTREVIDQRLAMQGGDALSPDQRATLRAVVDRIVPQPEGRAPTNAAILVMQKIADDASDGYRHHELPHTAAAWRRGLDAIAAEAQARFGKSFPELDATDADFLLRAIEDGQTEADAWADLPPQVFWAWRLLPDIVGAYYAHPSAWSAMGFGGPAAPRGYVRLDTNRRDPWEAAEQGDGRLLPAAPRNRHVR